MFGNTLKATPVAHLFFLLLLSQLFTCLIALPSSTNGVTSYTRAELVGLRPNSPGPKPNGYEDFPGEIKARRRGRRGGARTRTRNRKSSPPLPTILLGNVRSLSNKMDELHACSRYLYEYRESCLLCFSETWLHKDIPDSSVDLPDFDIVRGDRTEESGKSRGGGVCVYINRRWCNNWCVKEKVCTPGVELLTVGLRPYYLPREFNQIFMMVVYIQPRADFHLAREAIASRVHQLQAASPDSPIFIAGDFNHCLLEDTLPSFDQYVTEPTRNGAVLDLCYGSIQRAYKAKPCPQLGFSDHSNVLLSPTYKTQLKRNKPVTKTCYVWGCDETEELRACFDSTDWNVFLDSADSLNEAVEVITEYINFCVGNVIPEKIVKVYPNNKPWISSELRISLKEKRTAFRMGDAELGKEIQKKIKRQIRECKVIYKQRLEQKFSQNNTRASWQAMEKITGYKSRVRMPDCSEVFVNDLNAFFSRFEVHDYTAENENVHKILTEMPSQIDVVFSETDVRNVLGRVKLNKAPGPDGICNRVLKSCNQQLAPVLTKLFQMTLDSGFIPQLWKMAKIIPIPKGNTSKTRDLNDFRPVALTSNVMKCLERLILRFILKYCGSFIDSNQYAYKERRGVDDAVIAFLHNIYEHLDKPKSYVRLIYIDFSSAFNTITPHLLVHKLIEMGLDSKVTLWIHNFLIGRLQFVKAGNFSSNVVATNVGAPQGCVLSPALYSLYTSDFVSSSSACSILKYADDTVISGYLTDDATEYVSEINRFVEWCDNHNLMLNATKTKEMIIDFRRNPSEDHSSISIHGETIERVHEYKYLGTIIDDKLKWNKNTHFICTKANQRMFFLRKMKKFHVDNTILLLFYKSVIQSVLLFNLICMYGNLSQDDKRKLERPRRIAQRVIGETPLLPTITSICEERMLKKSLAIRNDLTHPLNYCFSFNRSGLRLCVPRTRGRGSGFLLSQT